MNIFTAPLYAISNHKFYHYVIASPLSKAFQYLLYLSLITSVFGVIAFQRLAMPLAVDFVEWFKSEMPIISISQEGIFMDAPSPYVMNHPEYGALVTFDMEISNVSVDDMVDKFILVTNRNVYVRQGDGSVDTYDLVSNLQRGAADGNQDGVYFITPDSIDKFFVAVRPWLSVFVFIMTFIFFYIWKMTVALFYAWLGLIYNLNRNPKLEFGQIYCVSIFAMTLGICLQWATLAAPVFDDIPLLNVLGTIATIFYIYVGVKKTQPEDPSISQ